MDCELCEIYQAQHLALFELFKQARLAKRHAEATVYFDRAQDILAEAQIHLRNHAAKSKNSNCE